MFFLLFLSLNSIVSFPRCSVAPDGFCVLGSGEVCTEQTYSTSGNSLEMQCFFVFQIKPCPYKKGRSLLRTHGSNQGALQPHLATARFAQWAKSRGRRRLQLPLSCGHLRAYRHGSKDSSPEGAPIFNTLPVSCKGAAQWSSAMVRAAAALFCVFFAFFLLVSDPLVSEPRPF